MKFLNKTVAAIILVSTGLVGIAYAEQEKSDNDALAVKNAKISLKQAVDIALERVPGTAVEVELESDDGMLIWEVDVVNVQQQVYELEIDAISGKILKQEMENDDNEKEDKNEKNEKDDDKK